MQITFSAIVLHRLWTWALGVISTVSFGLLFWISRDVPAFHEHAQSGEFSLHLFGMWIAFAAAALLISFFVGKLSTESRQKELELRLMEKRLARNDRLASLVTLSAGAAHEIATPLATIAVTAKEMEREAGASLRNTRLQEDAQLIRAQVERCRVILERMGAQGADPFGETPRPIDLHDLLSTSGRSSVGPGEDTDQCPERERPNLRASRPRRCRSAVGTREECAGCELRRQTGFIAGSRINNRARPLCGS